MPHDLLPALRERVRRIEQPTTAMHGVLPFGVAAIDQVLPGGGLARGALHEILGAGGDQEDGALAAAFAASIVAQLAPEADGIVLWCLARPDLYGPGLAVHGLDPARLVVVRAARDAEILWAMEEGLRTPGVAAVLGEVGTLPNVASRRLQLAAERSGITAFVLRRWHSGEQAACERNLPSAAVTRWRIAALPSRPIAIPCFPLESGVLHYPPLQIRPKPVMPGLVPGIHAPQPARPISEEDVDGRDKPGHDDESLLRFSPLQPKQLLRGWVTRSHGVEPGIGYPRWRVELLRCRGGAPACWTVEVREGQVRDATDTLSVAAALADRAPAPVGGDVRPLQRLRRTG